MIVVCRVDLNSSACLSARFAKVDCAQHIAARVELRIGYRSGDVDLRGEVEDDVRVRGDDADAPSRPRHAKIAELARVPI
jgi:hypothetical protein